MGCDCTRTLSEYSEVSYRHYFLYCRHRRANSVTTHANDQEVKAGHSPEVVARIRVSSRILVGHNTCLNHGGLADKLDSVAIVPLTRLGLIIRNTWILDPKGDADFSCMLFRLLSSSMQPS